MSGILSKKKIKSNDMLSMGDSEYLLKKLELTKSPQKKCAIAVKLSFVKNNPEIIRPILKLLPLWQKTEYGGTKIIVYSRLMVNYYLSNKKIFLNLLNSVDNQIRRIISHAFCFAILADGVDNNKAWKLYRKYFRKILADYAKKEKLVSNKKFILDFTSEHR